MKSAKIWCRQRRVIPRSNWWCFKKNIVFSSKRCQSRPCRSAWTGFLWRRGRSRAASDPPRLGCKSLCFCSAGDLSATSCLSWRPRLPLCCCCWCSLRIWAERLQSWSRRTMTTMKVWSRGWKFLPAPEFQQLWHETLYLVVLGKEKTNRKVWHQSHQHQPMTTWL